MYEFRPESLARGLAFARAVPVMVSAADYNGNVARITTPTGCRIRFTGVRVTKHDGARHHLVGIQPTIPASRTIAGVLAGRDEVLEGGLAYVRDSK